MQEQTYPRAWRWNDDGDQLEGRFLRIEEAVTSPTSSKVAAVLVLDVEGHERSLWLWTLALKRFATDLARVGVSPPDTALVEHLGTTMLDEDEAAYRREYRFSVNGEVVAV